MIADEKTLDPEVKTEFRLAEDCLDELLGLFEHEDQEDFPYNAFNGYVLEQPEEVKKFREDIIAGTTCVQSLVWDYLNEETNTFDEAFDQGVTFMQLIFQCESMEQTHAFALRNRVEDLLTENQGDTLRIVGSAMGAVYAYLEVAIFDIEEFREKLLFNYFVEPLQKEGIESGFIQVFRHGEQPYSLFDEEEE